MEITDLIAKQVTQTQADQIEWQKIIKAAIRKHGWQDKDKVVAEVEKRIADFAEKMVTRDIKLGMEWLKDA